MRTLTRRFISQTQFAINNAIPLNCIQDVTRAAHLARIACGYRITRPVIAFTASDLAWFRRSVEA